MIDLKQVFLMNPECEFNSLILKSVLSDLYPQQKRDIRILCAILDCGIAKRIKESKDLNVLQIPNIVSYLDSEFGFSKEYSLNCLKTWITAYHGNTEQFYTCYSKVDLWSSEAKSVLNKYFTESNFFFKAGNLTINTKHCIFSVLSEDSKTRNLFIFDYENFQIHYKITEKEIEIWMQTLDEESNKYSVATISLNTLNDNELQELVAVLEYMSTFDVTENFIYAFDENLKWYQIPDTNDYYIMKNHFSGERIEPFAFYAKSREHDETFEFDANESILLGVHKFYVLNSSRKPWDYNDMQAGNAKTLYIEYPPDENNSIKKEIFELSKEREDIYINKDTKSVFIGDLHQYTQFMFDDLETAYKAFDYLKILFTHIV